MSMDVTIRKYRNDDLAACRKLWVELTQHHRDIYQTQDIGGSEPGKAFDKYLRNERLHGPWVAEHQGVVVGMTGLLVGGSEAEVEPVVVSAGFRSKGVGKKLVRHAVAEARGLGVRFLSIKPVARNIEAFSFFTGQGFNNVGHIELFQELDGSGKRQWVSGMKIHTIDLKY